MHALATRLFPICRSITGAGVRATLAILGDGVNRGRVPFVGRAHEGYGAWASIARRIMARPWISILLPFYFMNSLRRRQWMSQVVTYGSPPPDLSARGRRDYDEFARYVNSSIVAGLVYTVLFVTWVCIFQGNVAAASPPAWAMSIIVGNPDPSW